MHTTANSLDNKLLARLPRRDFETLAAHLTHVSLPQGEIVYETGDEADHIYFPSGGMFSQLAVMRDGKAIETATVGREGVIGAMLDWVSINRWFARLSSCRFLLARSKLRLSGALSPRAIQFAICAFAITKSC